MFQCVNKQYYRIEYFVGTLIILFKRLKIPIYPKKIMRIRLPCMYQVYEKIPYIKAIFCSRTSRHQEILTN